MYFLADIIKLVTMETHEAEDPEQDLLRASRNGDTNAVADLLEKRKNGELELDINCKGIMKQNDNSNKEKNN